VVSGTAGARRESGREVWPAGGGSELSAPQASLWINTASLVSGCVEMEEEEAEEGNCVEVCVQPYPAARGA
jgi:hypothetical protein